MSNNQSNDLFPKMSVDELINSIEKDMDLNNNTSSKSWSIDEIDALLDLGSNKEKSKPFESVIHEVKVSEKPQDKPIIENNIEKKIKIDSYEQEKVGESNSSDDTYFIDDLKEDNPKEDLKTSNSEIKQDSKILKIDKTKILDKPNIERKSKEKSQEEKLQQNKKLINIKPENFAESVTDNSRKISNMANEYPQSKVEISQKTLADVVPTYNKNIKHNIIQNKVETHVGSIETDKYRARFINAPTQKIERTAEYQSLHKNDPKPVIERPGIIIKKKDFRGTADLEPIPTIISADEELGNEFVDDKTQPKKVGSILKDTEQEIEGQIKLSGFNEEEKLEQIDEDVAEQELRDKREDKIKSFKINADFIDFPTQELGEQFKENEEDFYDHFDEYEEDIISKKEESLPFNEFTSVDEKLSIIKGLAKKCRLSFGIAIIQTFIFAVSLILNITYNNSELSLIPKLNNELTFVLANMLLLLFSCAFATGTAVKGIKGLFKFKTNASTGSFLVFLFSFIQLIILIISYQDGIPNGTILFSPVACFAMMCTSYAKFVTLKRVQRNFDFCTGGTGLYSTERISDDEDAFEIGRGLLLGEPDIRYSSKIAFPKDFMKNSFAHDPVNSLHKIIIPIILLVSSIVAIAKGILTKDAFTGYNSFLAVFCFGFPAFSLFISNLPLLLINKKLNQRGCALLGHNPAYNCNGTNAIVVDASDLFMKGYVNIDGIKTFHNMRIDEAILDAAALVIKAGGPLVNVFDSVILNRREILPPVESIAYEDRLGLSAWVQNRRILLGSRDLLENHNVEVPDKSIEEKYLKCGKKVIYLSVAGKIAAMFVISYYANHNIENALQEIEDSGVTTLVRTCDCNITEELICKYFDLDENSVKIISPVSGKIYEKYRKETLESSSSGIYHNGTDDSFIKSVVQSLRLNRIVSTNSIIQIIYAFVSCVIATLFVFLFGVDNITTDKIIILQTIFAFIGSMIPIAYRT